jgi:8-oxo-dGTP pyrophosphatase MutT (NUDIX family)
MIGMANMQKRRFHRAGTLVLIEKEGKILLLKRQNTGYRDGWYNPPGGHLDEGESLRRSAAREAFEETGITVLQKDLDCINVMHKFENDGDSVMFTMKAKRWKGTPANMEPKVCGGIGWFRAERLPKKTIPYVRHLIKNIRSNVFYSEFGW